EQLRGERLRLERSDQGLERRLDRAEPEHRFDPAGLEQILRHVKDDQRGIAEIGETLPGLGREQHREAARMAEEFGGGITCRWGGAVWVHCVRSFIGGRWTSTR